MFRTYELIEHSPSLFMSESYTIFPFCPPSLDLLSPPPFFNDFDFITDFEKTPFYTTRRVKSQRSQKLYLKSLSQLSDRVAALELTFDSLSKPKKSTLGERKYTWTTEIKSPEENGVDRKYKWVAEMKDGGKNGDKNYRFSAEIKGKAETKSYKFEASCGEGSESSKKMEEKVGGKKKMKKAHGTRVVEITDQAADRGALVLKQAISRRGGMIRGKQKELSPQDAALLIQMSFRAYLIRRSQALRALRELAIAKTKLKELRGLFNNFTYRRRVARDAEERQKFTEKIIVLLLTVDAVEGADLMVRSAKKSMVDELEAMLDVVDPQPAGRSLSMRRTFDMPDAVIQKELAAGVSQIVQMLEEDASPSEVMEG
ncbi:hypothetical protein Leryth_006934 [Lithospermum erythrorhizon]|nr:hypothetical protein Leryth_006934 [Lithospermum erythrorhizon]